MSDGAQAQALETFLRADPQEWAVLAPRVVAAVGEQRLSAIVAGTRERVGTPLEVRDSSRGLLIKGPKGRVLGWADLRAGRIESLLIAPYRQTWRTTQRATPEWLSRVIFVALLLWSTISTWMTSERGNWAGYVLLTLAVYVYRALVNAVATQPWWFRRASEALVLATVASSWRWSRMKPGGLGWAVWGIVVLTAVITVVVRGRRHRWVGSPAQPLSRLPLHGEWLVVQGGGWLLNHHFRVLEQRGAVDVVQLGRNGVRTGTGRLLTDFVAYGKDVVAPCEGVVRSAVGGLPDQTPGKIRFGPLYGNHVVIDTGTERVVLAHLRPGTVAVSRGDQVQAGQYLGQIGNSGNSTAPHLHLHAERDGVGLNLDFATIDGNLYSGRTVRG